MIRSVFRLFAIFIVALFLRQVVMFAIRAFSRLAGPAEPPGSSPREQSAGELKRDPVCGTYVAVTSSIKTTEKGEVLHFCSTACRDKYQRVA